MARREESILQSYLRKPRVNIEEPWWSRDLGNIVEAGINVMEKSRERNKNSVINSLNILPQLAGMIKDEASLENYERLSKELSDNASKYPETALYSPLVQSVSSNIREDWNAYTKAMEQAAKLFDSDEYIDTAEGWDNLDGAVSAMTIEGTDTPKYQGNGTILYLTEQQDKINSILSRIQNASKGTQFRYNKADNKYMDHEVIEKLDKHSKRIAIATEAAFGDGIITKDEAELIMTGNMDKYESIKSDKLKVFNTEMKRMNRLEESIFKERAKLVKGQGSAMSDQVLALVQSGMSTELDSAQGDDEETQVIDTEFTGNNAEELLEELKERKLQVYGRKNLLRKMYKAWEGRDYLEGAKKSDDEIDKYGSEILDEMTEEEKALALAKDKAGGADEVVEGADEVVEEEAEVEDEEGITDKNMSDLNKLRIAAAGAGVAAWQSERIVAAGKIAKDVTVKSAKYIEELTHLKPSQITQFLESKDVGANLGRIEKLDTEIETLKSRIDNTKGMDKLDVKERLKLSKDKRALSSKTAEVDKIKSKMSKRWAKKFKTKPRIISSLFKKGTIGKWNLWKAKAGLPKLGTRYAIGNIITNTLFPDREEEETGLIDLATYVGVGYGAEKIATKRFFPTLMKIIKSPRGKKYLSNWMSEKAIKKLGKSAVAGGGYLSLATSLVGAGLLAKDINEIVKNWKFSEEELMEDEQIKKYEAAESLGRSTSVR